jgi:FixJ family two-component response regulator
MIVRIPALASALPADHLEEASLGAVAIVDDDPSVRRALARLIGAYSFEPRPYSSAREFLDSLNNGAPACLLVDLQMDDMTGLELLHRLAGLGLKIPTIVVTAQDEPGMRHRCSLAGATAFLVKPVTGDPLLEAIEAAIGAPPHDVQLHP